MYLLTHIMEVISFQTLSYFLRSVKDQQRREVKWSVAYYLQNWYVLVAYGLFAAWGFSTVVATASSGMQKSNEKEEEGTKGILEKEREKECESEIATFCWLIVCSSNVTKPFFSDSLLASFQNPYKKRTVLYFYAFQCN